MTQKGIGKNLYLNTVGMVMYNLAIWVLSVLIFRLLGADASGTYAIASGIGNTLYAAALYGMRTFIVSDSEHRYSCNDFMRARVVAIGITFLVLIGIVLVTGYSTDQKLAIFTYSVFKLFEALIEVLDCFCQREKQMRVNAGSMILRSIVYIIVFAGMLTFTNSLNAGFLALSVCSILIFAFYNLPRVKKITDLTSMKSTNKITRKIMRQCFSIMAFEMLSSLIVAIPRLFYDTIGDHAQLGTYTSIYTLVIFLQLVCNILIYSLAPYMADAWNHNEKKQFYKFTAFLVAGTLLLGLLAEGGTLVLGRFAIGILYGADAVEGTSYLYLGICSGVSLALTWIISQISVIQGHNDDQLVSSIAATIVCVILSLTILTADCNSISVVLIITNITFMLVQALQGFIRGKR